MITAEIIEEDVEEQTEFTFDQLSEKAKDRARNWFATSMGYEWWDSVYDDWKDKLRAKGIDCEKIYFSGFWSQGDGACFEGRFDNPATFMQEHGLDVSYPFTFKLAEQDGVALRIKQSGHYYHENSVGYWFDYSEFDIDESSEVMAAIKLVHEDGQLSEQDDFEKRVEEICREYMKDIYHDLETEYEYLTSDEAIAETCEANDYKFDADGYPA